MSAFTFASRPSSLTTLHAPVKRLLHTLSVQGKAAPLQELTNLLHTIAEKEPSQTLLQWLQTPPCERR